MGTRAQQSAGAAAVAVLAAVALASPAPAASCRSVSVDRGGDEEGAYRIRTENIRCRPARRVVRSYLRTGAPPGDWKLQKTSRAFRLYKGERRITFRVAS